MGKSLNYLNPKHGYILIKDIKDNYGWKFWLLMTSGYFGVIGVTHYLIKFIQLPYWQEVGHDATVQAEMAAISTAPWTIKGLIGIISDCIPIFGHYKTAYMYMYTIIGYLSIAGLAFMPLTFVYDYPIVGGMLFFGANIFPAAYDLFMESKYISLMQKYPNRKANLLSYAWGVTLVGQLLPASLVGYLSKIFGVQTLFMVFFPLVLPPLVPLFLGGMIEDKVEPFKNNKVDMEKVRSDWQLVLLATIQSIIATLLVVVGQVTTNSTIPLVFIILASLTMSVLGFIYLHNYAARMNVYIILAQSLYVNIQSGLEYFYTADEDCYPGGPQFDMTFLRSWGTIFLTVAQLIAVFIFQIYMKNWSFRLCFWFTTAIRIVASFSDFLIVKRWTVSLGISDEFIYLFGYSIFSEFAYMLDFLPTIVMISKLSPKGLEATFFSLLGGNFNYGVSCAYYIGVFLYDIFGIVSLADVQENIACNFDNLQYVIIMAHIVLPAVSIILVFVLVPKFNLFDILIDDNYYATKNKKKKLDLTPINNEDFSS